MKSQNIHVNLMAIICFTIILVFFLNIVMPAKALSQTSEEIDNTFLNEKYIAYETILAQIETMQDQIGTVSEAASTRLESSIPLVSNDDIANWFEYDNSFEHTSFESGNRLRDENEVLLIKRRPAYLRIINKIALEENRDMSLLESKTLQLSEEEAMDQGYAFLEYLGISKKDISDVDIKKVIGETGDETGVLDRVEAEYLVTFYRQQQEAVVADSMIRLAVNNKSEVTRVLAKWPELEPREIGTAVKENSKIALEVYQGLYEIFYKDPKVKYVLIPVVAHRIENRKTIANPVMRVIAAKAEGGFVFGFDIDLVE